MSLHHGLLLAHESRVDLPSNHACVGWQVTNPVDLDQSMLKSERIFGDVSTGQKAMEINPQRVLHTLIDNLDGMVFRGLFDRQWTMIFVSAGCHSLTGYSPQQIVRNHDISYFEITHPEDRDQVRKVLDEAVTGRQRYRVDYRIVRGDGQVR